MSETVTVQAQREAPGRRPITPLGAFFAVLGRDIFVTVRELPIFLAQVVLQPLFLLFVFGKILTQLGYAQHGYAQVLFPGLVALASVLTGLQSTAFPLVIAPFDTHLIINATGILRAGVPLMFPVSVLSGISFTFAGAALRNSRASETEAVGLLAPPAPRWDR